MSGIWVPLISPPASQAANLVEPVWPKDRGPARSSLRQEGQSGPFPSYLHRRVGVLDVVLQVAHEHEVPGLVPARVQGVVVDVAEDGTRSDAVRAVLGIDVLAQPLHQHSRVLTLVLRLVLLRLGGWRRMPLGDSAETAAPASTLSSLVPVPPCVPPRSASDHSQESDRLVHRHGHLPLLWDRSTRLTFEEPSGGVSCRW